jgi:transposase
MQTPTYLLPDPTLTQFDSIIQANEAVITLELSVTQQTAACPLCAQPARRVHSRYCRTVADLPWADRPVRIHLQVRRFFCDNLDCQRTIFTERLPTVVAPWARRTQRLASAQQQLGLIAGGAGGTKLAAALAMPAGVDLLLTLIRRCRPPERPTPRVLGVDDWAQRKGDTYGTILVDLEQGWVVDLLADRTAETLARWLRHHPGIEIVSRDRAEAYAQGVRQGAPQAIQVADRFHLLKNLAEVVGKVFQHHHQRIEKAFAPALPVTAPIATSTLPIVEPAASAPAKADARYSAADRRRQQRAETAYQYHQQGWTAKAIAQHLGLHPKTVRRYLHTSLPLPPLRRTRHRLLDPYLPYLLRRWNEGCHNGAQLLRELQAQGFGGHYTILCAFVRQLRQASGLRPRTRSAGDTLLTIDSTQRPPTPRSLTWLVVREPHELTEAERQAVAKLRTLHPHIETTVRLAQEFAAMVRHRQQDQLDPWLRQAVHSGISSWRNFAHSLQHDLAAVRTALETVWSNGPTEGHVNRLKCLKRQMYGRAKLDLLRQRLLAA